jgi:ethanolamine transporter EutH
MSTLLSILLVSIVIGGGYYFWLKALVHGFNMFGIILSYIFWPVAVTTGLYWALRDMYWYLKGRE